MRVIGTSTTAYRNALYYEDDNGQRCNITASKSVSFDELWRRALEREGYEVEEKPVQEPVKEKAQKVDSSQVQEQTSERAGKGKSKTAKTEAVAENRKSGSTTVKDIED